MTAHSLPDPGGHTDQHSAPAVLVYDVLQSLTVLVADAQRLRDMIRPCHQPSPVGHQQVLTTELCTLDALLIEATRQLRRCRDLSADAAETSCAQLE